MNTISKLKNVQRVQITKFQKNDDALFSKSATFQKFSDFIFSEFRNRHTILIFLSLRPRLCGDELKYILLLKLYHTQAQK